MARTNKTVYPFFFFFFSSLHVLPRFACQDQDAFSKRTGSIFASCRFVLLCSVPYSTSLGLFVPYDRLDPYFEISRPYIHCLDQEKKVSFPCPTGGRPRKKTKKKKKKVAVRAARVTSPRAVAHTRNIHTPHVQRAVTHSNFSQARTRLWRGRLLKRYNSSSIATLQLHKTPLK